MLEGSVTTAGFSLFHRRPFPRPFSFDNPSTYNFSRSSIDGCGGFSPVLCPTLIRPDCSPSLARVVFANAPILLSCRQTWIVWIGNYPPPICQRDTHLLRRDAGTLGPLALSGSSVEGAPDLIEGDSESGRVCCYCFTVSVLRERNPAGNPAAKHSVPWSRLAELGRVHRPLSAAFKFAYWCFAWRTAGEPRRRPTRGQRRCKQRCKQRRQRRRPD